MIRYAKPIKGRDNRILTCEVLISLGFEDLSGGWGRSTGDNIAFKKDGLEIQTVDYDGYFHKFYGGHISFKYVYQIEDYFNGVPSKNVHLNR